MSFEIKTELMAHQKEALAKMIPTRIGGLFMDLGTGKTLVVIKLSQIRLHKIDKVIYFCPVSLKETIKEQILTHSNLTEKDICVFDHKINESKIPNALFYICGIESMSSGKRVILTIYKLITEKTFVVVDESTYIKGYRAWRTERITSYSEIARYRIILTGTPLTQGIIDLYAQMRFLSPKILGYSSFYSFEANHLEYSKKYKNKLVRVHNTDELAAKIAPYVYQVTKEECLELPEKLYTYYSFTMTMEQRQAYEQAKYDILYNAPDNYLDSMYAIFQLFTALQSITSGFWNRNLSISRNEEKREFLEFKHRRLDTLEEVINHIPDNRKVIIWAKFQYDIKAITNLLLDSCCQFHGKLSEKQRNQQVKLWKKSKEKRFLVATPSTAGHGLTLTEAHYSIFYNNGFKYSERLQAEDRLHRISQNTNVTYIDIYCQNSIDERIHKALRAKENVLESFRSEIEKVKKENLKEALLKL